MSSIYTKTAAFTIADADVDSADKEAVYRCTGAFAVTIPSAGVTAGNKFVVISEDGSQTFVTTGATVDLPAGRELLPYPVTTGESATMVVSCLATGDYKVDGDLNPTNWGEISFSAAVDTELTTFTAGAEVVVKWDTLNYNYGNGFNTATDRFVAPQDGRYHFDATVLLDTPVSVDTRYDIKFQINGVSQHTIVDFSNVADFFALTASADLEVSKDDYVQVIIHNRHATVDEEIYDGGSSQQFSFFTGHLIGGIKGDTGDFGSVVYKDEVSFGASNSSFSGTTGWNAISFTGDYNNGTIFGSPAANRFSAPVAGRYQFNCQFNIIDNSAGDCIVVFLKNGLGVASSYNNRGGNYDSVTISDQLDLAEGDTVGVSFYSPSDSAYTLQQCRFTGHLISPSVTLAPNGITQAFSVNKNASNQTVTGDTWEKLTWAFVAKETNVSFDLTNNEFVVPSSGWWHFDAYATFLDVVDIEQVKIRIDVDGSVAAEGTKVRNSTSAGDSMILGVSKSIYLKVGEAVSISVFHGGAATESIGGANTATWFSGHKISGTSTGVEYDSYDIAFTAYDGTGYSLASGATSKIDIDTISYDKGGNFDTTNNRFIAPVTGVYMFNGAVQVSNLNDNESLHTHLYKNGTTAFASGSRSTISDSGAAGQQARSVVAGQVELNAGEYVDIWAYQNTGVAQTCSATVNNTFLSGHLVRATTKAECSFRAYLSGDQTTTASGETVVELDTIDFDNGAGFDTTNNKFVAPAAGRYLFTYAASMTSLTTTTTDFLAYIKVNGASASHGNRAALAATTSAQITGSTGSIILDLAKGDEVKLYIFQDESTTETINSHIVRTNLAGYRLVSSAEIAQTATASVGFARSFLLMGA